ncbi:hypothetical protein FOZ63_005404 [Perkinsus olseni]|uniref:Uncharacterized protein n=1 Tax=Perkinsus olseni TaxID=32597 RepID=A0A7J6T082_PEROL|nr:hypothetical protein FOZ63_005404 [Perkinsus olseni]
MLESATHRIIVSDRQPNEALTFQMFYSGGFALDRGQRLETARTPTLVNLWLEGLPPALRCKIWPIAIGNNLRITSDTFSTLTRKVHRAERKDLWSQSQRTYLARFKNDLESDLVQTFIGKVVQWLHTFGTREQLEGFLDAATEDGYRRLRAHESMMDDQGMIRTKSSGSDDDDDDDTGYFCECESGDDDEDDEGDDRSRPEARHRRPSRGGDECGVAVEAIPSPAHGLATPNTIRSRAPSDSVGGAQRPATDGTSVGSHSRCGDSTVICERCRKIAIKKKLNTKRTFSEPWEEAWQGGGKADTSGEVCLAAAAAIQQLHHPLSGRPDPEGAAHIIIRSHQSVYCLQVGRWLRAWHDIPLRDSTGQCWAPSTRSSFLHSS